MEIFTIFLIVILLRDLKTVKAANAILKTREERAVKENITWRNIIPKTIRLSEANAENIKTLSGQQQILNRFVGEVLNVSNLIPNKEFGVEVSDIIEELRERVRWAQELEKYQSNNNDFYQGD
ncbi:hypothetical protein [Microcoleus sp. Pol12B5]|uniref:hypothetical protein n=1 Tax=Microcoleus sp. Pol12B5 TaxID=3055396 RepID=UPI002FD52803